MDGRGTNGKLKNTMSLACMDKSKKMIDNWTKEKATERDKNFHRWQETTHTAD